MSSLALTDWEIQRTRTFVATISSMAPFFLKHMSEDDFEI